jgi:molybdopterin/thiamine biosynthesis adenylyltransferase
MPHRVIIFCFACTKKEKRPVEVTEVTFWIDEDRAIYFIANCACGRSETVKTSAEELANKYHHHEAAQAVPQFVM